MDPHLLRRRMFTCLTSCCFLLLILLFLASLGGITSSTSHQDDIDDSELLSDFQHLREKRDARPEDYYTPSRGVGERRTPNLIPNNNGNIDAGKTDQSSPYGTIRVTDREVVSPGGTTRIKTTSTTTQIRRYNITRTSYPVIPTPIISPVPTLPPIRRPPPPPPIPPLHSHDNDIWDPVQPPLIEPYETRFPWGIY